MTTALNDIRSTFLDYFAKHGHEVVASSPLVPRNDPTLMFTNAGMVQFKNVFTGAEKRAATRAVHDRLHESAQFAAILAGTVDATSYRRLLLKLYGFHKPLEDALLRGAARCGGRVAALIAGEPS